MPLSIPEYQYIQHNITIREWGIECQFTVINKYGFTIDDIVIIDRVDIDDGLLSDTILNRLVLSDNKRPIVIDEDIS